MALVKETVNTLNSMADKEILGTDAQKLRFKIFAKHFWGSRDYVDFLYVMDWIKRFNRGDEYIYADSERTKILVDKVDGITKARVRARKQFEAAGWSKAYIEKQLKEIK